MTELQSFIASRIKQRKECDASTIDVVISVFRADAFINEEHLPSMVGFSGYYKEKSGKSYCFILTITAPPINDYVCKEFSEYLAINGKDPIVGFLKTDETSFNEAKKLAVEFSSIRMSGYNASEFFVSRRAIESISKYGLRTDSPYSGEVSAAVSDEQTAKEYGIDLGASKTYVSFEDAAQAESEISKALRSAGICPDPFSIGLRI